MTTTFVLMAGLPGTGKTTLAKALAEATEGVVLSKDTIRAALFPGPFTDYTTEQDDLCYCALLDAATYIASHHYSDFIFLDGRTFRKRSQIEAAIRAAEVAGCRWRILHLTCSDDVALARIAQDQSSARHPAGNRDAHLYLESKLHFEPIDYPCLRLDTSVPLHECLRICLAYLQGTSGSAKDAVTLI